jgi:class 3 adenylate cyclase
LRRIRNASPKLGAASTGSKYMGDGILAYFGYPRAHEDDAKRVDLAGLERIATVSGLGCFAAERVSGLQPDWSSLA